MTLQCRFLPTTKVWPGLSMCFRHQVQALCNKGYLFLVCCLLSTMQIAEQTRLRLVRVCYKFNNDNQDNHGNWQYPLHLMTKAPDYMLASFGMLFSSEHMGRLSFGNCRMLDKTYKWRFRQAHVPTRYSAPKLGLQGSIPISQRDI